jgi:hypothetical protein
MTTDSSWIVVNWRDEVLAKFPSKEQAREYWRVTAGAAAYREARADPKPDPPIEYDEFDQSED